MIERVDTALRRCGMSARGLPTRSRSVSAKRLSLAASPPTAKPVPGERFDARAFLARAGLGRRILNLKKGEVAFAQGDPADAIFYVQKDRLRITVTSANGK